jgi:hypothetical protein
MPRTRPLALLFAVGTVTAAGCGLAPLGSAPPPGPEARPLFGPATFPGPVADLSGEQLGLPRLFVGLGISRISPRDSTLARSSEVPLDLNISFDLSSWMTLEFLAGFWSVGDEPPEVSGADSELEMVPVLAQVQFYADVPSRKSRVYVGLGGGWSINDYHVGPVHREYKKQAESLANYDADAKDGALFQGVVGVEAYSTSDAKLNLAVEARYVFGEADKVEILDGSERAGEFDIKLWILRANLTWHF